MPWINNIRTLYLAFYSKHTYIRAAREWKGIGFGYLFVMIFSVDPLHWHLGAHLDQCGDRSGRENDLAADADHDIQGWSPDYR